MAIIDALRGEKLLGHFEQRLQGRIAGEFQIGQTHAINQYLVSADGGRGVEANGGAGRDKIILFNAIAAYAQAADQHTILVERHAAGEKDDAALVGIARLMSVGARVGDIELKEIEEWPGRAGIYGINARGKQWLRAKTYGAIGDRR